MRKEKFAINTIIVNAEEIDSAMNKYNGTSTPFMFDNFNLIVKSSNFADLKFKVRDYKTETIHTIIVSLNKGAWIGISTGEQRDQSLKESAIIQDKKTGDVTFGELFIPSSIMTYEEFDELMSEILTDYGYKKNKDMLQVVCNILCCIMMMGLERQRLQRKKNSQKSHHKSNSKSESSHKNRIYLLEDIVEYISDNYIGNKDHYEIQCPCWEVRGHYRHYKNGKVVFVKAFKKGKDRLSSEPKSRDYYI